VDPLICAESSTSSSAQAAATLRRAADRGAPLWFSAGEVVHNCKRGKNKPKKKSVAGGREWGRNVERCGCWRRSGTASSGARSGPGRVSAAGTRWTTVRSPSSPARWTDSQHPTAVSAFAVHPRSAPLLMSTCTSGHYVGSSTPSIARVFGRETSWTQRMPRCRFCLRRQPAWPCG